MTEPEVLIIGAGPAGYVSAIRLAQLGKKVLVVDEDEIGGVCLNRGCIPTKTLLHYTKIISETTKLNKFGIKFSKPEIDFNIFNQRVKEIPARLRRSIIYLFRINDINFINATAHFTNNKSILLTLPDGSTQTINPRYIIIATGSEPLALANISIDNQTIINSDKALEISEVPEKLIIIGAGAIGLEFATIYNRLGSKVEVIELMSQILPGTDLEIANHLMQIMTKQGIKFRLDTKLIKIDRSNVLNLHILYKQKEEITNADKILIAVGRSSNLSKLGLENTNIRLTEKKYILVNDYYKTSQKDIYAIGDIIGPPLLAHKAMAQGIFVAEKIAGNLNIKLPQLIPNCVYTDPELATVGLTESEAKALNYELLIGKAPLIAIGRAHTLGQIEGLAKVIINKNTNQLLGAQILAPEASNLINELTLIINSKLDITQILDTVHPHPTLSEIVVEAVAAAYKKAIHIKNH